MRGRKAQANGEATATATLAPLSAAEALGCRGGDDPIKSVKELLDWIIGIPPAPGQWPPMIL